MTETVPSAFAAAMRAVRSAPEAAGALPAGAEPAAVSAGALAAVLGALDAPGLEQAATTRAKIANGVTDRSSECLVIKVGSPIDGEIDGLRAGGLRRDPTPPPMAIAGSLGGSG